MFSNQQSSQPAGASSLFAGLGSSSATGGNNAAAGSTEKRGLFDTATQQQSRPSPFSGGAGTLSGSTLLGSGSSTATPTAATTVTAPTLSAGLSGFGAMAGGSAAAAQQPQPSIYSNTNTASVFGGRTPGPSQPTAPGSSLFASQQPSQQQQPQQQQQQNQPLPLGGQQSQQPGQQQNQQQQQSFAGKSVSAKQATQPAFFNSLLERGKKRAYAGGGENGNFGELPSLQFGLDDIRRKARELGDGPGTPQKGADSKAYG
jgi:hypothetical protein